jgi:CheY-like chemotaxis protein
MELCVKNRRPLSGIHVLIVDDNDDALDVFKTVLSFLGALTTARRSATSAVGVLTLVTPDVIVTDITMPGRDGLWLLQQVRASGRGIPVLAVTANKYADLSAFDGGAYKPVDLEQLTDLVLDAVVPRRKSSS